MPKKSVMKIKRSDGITQGYHVVTMSDQEAFGEVSLAGAAPGAQGSTDAPAPLTKVPGKDEWEAPAPAGVADLEIEYWDGSAAVLTPEKVTAARDLDGSWRVTVHGTATDDESDGPFPSSTDYKEFSDDIPGWVQPYLDTPPAANGFVPLTYVEDKYQWEAPAPEGAAALEITNWDGSEAALYPKHVTVAQDLDDSWRVTVHGVATDGGADGPYLSYVDYKEFSDDIPEWVQPYFDNPPA